MGTAGSLAPPPAGVKADALRARPARGYSRGPFGRPPEGRGPGRAPDLEGLPPGLTPARGPGLPKVLGPGGPPVRGPGLPKALGPDGPPAVRGPGLPKDLGPGGPPAGRGPGLPKVLGPGGPPAVL